MKPLDALLFTAVCVVAPVAFALLVVFAIVQSGELAEDLRAQYGYDRD